jgi:hypothetical protein
MHQQAEEYKKSVTIIFWYQVTTPIMICAFDVDVDLSGKCAAREASPYDPHFSFFSTIENEFSGIGACLVSNYLSGNVQPRHWPMGSAFHFCCAQSRNSAAIALSPEEKSLRGT